jgi:hypothetical protein
MGIFFSYTHIFERENYLSPYLSCVGCLLIDVLRQEADHYKQKKRNIMRSWLVGSDGPNRDDLGKALSDYHNRQIEILAKKLTDQHLRDLTTGNKDDRYDRELNERQKPLTTEELSGKMGTHRRSPQIYEQLSGSGCDYIRVERYDGHGMWD